MEKVIVTGGAGFIGSHIVDALIERGCEVHVIDNLSSGKKEQVHAKAIFHETDIRDFEKIKQLFENVSYVFHQAAQPQVQYSIEHPIETHEINVTGTLNILEASRFHKVKRVIFAASSAAYGDQKILPLIESMEANPMSPYGAHKYIGEIYCKTWAEIYGLETVCLRYFNVYGPRQSFDSAYSSVIAKFINLRRLNKPLSITGDGNQTRDFVHVNDVARANLSAMTSESVGQGEVINIGGTEKVSINHIAELIGGPIEYVRARLEPQATLADISKAKMLLSWQPTITIEEGITKLKNI